MSVANLRVASTPRLKRDGRWVDGDTTWYSVTAWRGLADNVRDSLRKGDAVIVHGKLRTDVWERSDGQLSTTLCIDATMIGPDLNRGTARFERTTRAERGMKTMPIPRATYTGWAPTVVRSSMASRSAGRAIRASTIRISTSSTSPR